MHRVFEPGQDAVTLSLKVHSLYPQSLLTRQISIATKLEFTSKAVHDMRHFPLSTVLAT